MFFIIFNVVVFDLFDGVFEGLVECKIIKIKEKDILDYEWFVGFLV